MIVGANPQNVGFYTFYNIANLNIKLNVNDQLGLKFRLKDTYIALTNSGISNQNNLYIDRLSLFYHDDFFHVVAGRDLFYEKSGILIGNLADGLMFSTGLLGMKQRVYLYYSGLLPREINQFNMDAFDTNTGGNRLSAGIVLEKYGFLGQALSLTFLSGFDLSTNQQYYPLFLALDNSGAIAGNLVYTASLISQFGSVHGATNALFGWAGNVKLGYLLLEESKIGFSAEFSFATGDDTSTTNVVERFNALGRYAPSFVLNPEFANLWLLKFGASGKFFDEKLSVKVNYLALSRLTTNDTVNGFYNTSGFFIGNELNLFVDWQFDPSLSLFLSAGALFGGDARSNKTNETKLIVGGSIQI